MLYCDINAINIAVAGHMRMLGMIHGDRKLAEQRELQRAKMRLARQGAVTLKPQPITDVKGQTVMLTPAAFDKMFNRSKVKGSGGNLTVKVKGL